MQSSSSTTRAPPEGVVPEVDESSNPTVVLLRRDWEFLFDQLKSTHAVCGYFERVPGDSIELGDEPMRYSGDFARRHLLERSHAGEVSGIAEALNQIYLRDVD